MRARVDATGRISDRARSVVLVVTPDPVATQEITGWLAEEGHPVLACGGPCPPAYACPGTRGDACALLGLCDVAVLDLRLETDVMMTGIPGWQMLLTYRALGKRVIALTGPGDAVKIVSEPGVAVLPRRPGKDDLLRAVRSLSGELPDALPVHATRGRGGPWVRRLPTMPVADVADVWL
jgi:CheY-like chemotaxis protein